MTDIIKFTGNKIFRIAVWIRHEANATNYWVRIQ